MEKLIRLLLLLPFYIPALLMSFIAGMIGGRKWRVRIELMQHEEGQKMAEANLNIVFKE